MYVYKFSFIFILLIVMGVYSKNQECSFRTIEFKPDHLACMQNHILAKAVRFNLSKVEHNKKYCPECHEPFINAKKYLSLYGSSFMALGLSRQGFGGYNLYVVFKHDPKLYKLWFYEIDDNEFQLRRISEEEIHQELSDDIKNHQIASKYWQ